LNFKRKSTKKKNSGMGYRPYFLVQGYAAAQRSGIGYADVFLWWVLEASASR